MIIMIICVYTIKLIQKMSIDQLNPYIPYMRSNVASKFFQLANKQFTESSIKQKKIFNKITLKGQLI